MQALVKYAKGSGNVKVMDREMPEPKAGQVRVKVHYAGICGTDIHMYKDDGGYAYNPPVTLGHEFSGIVDAVGEGVDASLIGKAVVSETYFITCGHCFFCVTGKKNLCPERKSIGSGVDGAMAEYVVVPYSNIHLVPEGVSLKEAAMTEPLACCCQGVLEMADITPGEHVLLSGPGAIGLMCLQFAVLCGGRVVVTGLHADEERLQLALKLGAEAIVYSDDPDAKEQLKAKFAPHGADVVLECSGAGPAVLTGIEMIRKGGRYVQVGLTGRPTTLNMNDITLKELTVKGTFAQKPVWWTRSLELLAAKKIQVLPLISDVDPLTDWEKAFEGVIKGEGLKHMLTACGEE